MDSGTTFNFILTTPPITRTETKQNKTFDINAFFKLASQNFNKGNRMDSGTISDF